MTTTSLNYALYEGEILKNKIIFPGLITRISAEETPS